MKTKLLTDVELRAHWLKTGGGPCSVPAGTMLTPAARDFLREHCIELCFESAPAAMPMAPIPTENGKPQYVEKATGRTLSQKPEELTHLYGNVLVPKTDPRIELRGRLDSLSAAILEAQAEAAEAGDGELLKDLLELQSAVLTLLSCEVLEKPAEDTPLLGLDSDGIRRCSHRVGESFGIVHTMPDYRMGKLALRLNSLRCQTRETELSAARAYFENGTCTRPDVVERLNRLSSCFYILYCRKLSENEGRRAR